MGMFKNRVNWIHQILKTCVFSSKTTGFLYPLVLRTRKNTAAPMIPVTSFELQVCNCHSVPKKVIREAIMKGAHTFEAVGW